jgi:oxygen-independent coproporphyrinogen-3 oxidase
MAKLRSSFNLDDSGDDYGIEIDPRAANIATIDNLYKLGFRRLSMGVQDLDIEVQKAVHRIQPFELTKTLIDHARMVGFNSCSIDLIYGLPKQTIEGFAKTIDKVLTDLSPDRISLFNYAHLPSRFQPQTRIKEEDLPKPADKIIILEQTINTFLANNYVFIGMDHFAKPSDSLAISQSNGTLHRNFQGYTIGGHCDLLGLGVSSISQIGKLYSQNTSDLQKYQTTIGDGSFATAKGVWATEDDLIRRKIIVNLMCFFELDIRAIEQEFNLDFQQYFAELLPRMQQLVDDGLIQIDTHKITVNPTGRLLVRNVCMVFDRYLTGEMLKRFSKTI